MKVDLKVKMRAERMVKKRAASTADPSEHNTQLTQQETHCALFQGQDLFDRPHYQYHMSNN